MTAVKKMVGTEAFLDLPDEKKQCQQEVFEQCVQRNLLKQAEEICVCLSWTVEPGRQSGMSYCLKYFSYEFSFFQNLPIWTDP